MCVLNVFPSGVSCQISRGNAARPRPEWAPKMTSAPGLPRNAASAPVGRGGSTCDMCSAWAASRRRPVRHSLRIARRRRSGGEVASLWEQQQHASTAEPGRNLLYLLFALFLIGGVKNRVG